MLINTFSPTKCVCVWLKTIFSIFGKHSSRWRPLKRCDSYVYNFERAPKKKKKLLIDVGADVAQTQMETQTSWLDGRSNLPHCPSAIWWPTVHRWLTIWPLAAFGHLPYAGVLFMFFIHCFFLNIFFFFIFVTPWCANSTLAHWFIQQSTAGDPRDFLTRAWIELNWLE